LLKENEKGRCVIVVANQTGELTGKFEKDEVLKTNGFME